MGSGNNSTPVTSGLLRRRYSVPEIIMRKHSLAQQKIYEESVAATAPSPHRSPIPVYQKSFSTSTPPPHRIYPISSGSDSNLTRRPERGEMSMRKSTLLRRIWSRELKRCDTRSGSWSPPMRRSQRRFYVEPIESLRCEECLKLDDKPSDDSDEAASRKRLRLISTGKEPLDESYLSSYSTSVSDRIQMTTPSSLESTPLGNGNVKNVHIYMTPMKSTSEPTDEGQDMLRVEIDLDNNETSRNSNRTDLTISADENRNYPDMESSPTTASKTGDHNIEDSTLDRFISKLLIDNLADLADEINEQFENNNNLLRNGTSREDQRVSEVCLSREYVKEAVNGCHTPKVSSFSTSKVESSNEQIIYFPSFSLECKDDMSSYTSNCSDFELNNVPSSDLIKVSTGSTYPLSEQTEGLVVPRILGKLLRTESLEAQHSMTSVLDEENANDTDDSVSLVDSLDDPRNPADEQNESIEVNEEIEVETREEDVSSICRDKNEAFFVPITGSDSEEAQSVPVARSMPEKLKKKILQRQMELDTKREEELKKKQKKIEKIMDRKLEDENFYEKSPVRSKKNSPVKEKPPVQKKPEAVNKKTSIKGNAVLRTEIGLLESYTIDSKGNMLFKAPQKTDSSALSSSTTASTNTNIKKAYSSSRSQVRRKHGIMANEPPEIATHSFQNKSSTLKTKCKKSGIKDIQKMTIFQAQSDIITPDVENGPRRVYQKTEIQDGEKRIEILEIVECIETSPENSPDRQYITYRCATKSAMVARRSKIPIPIYKIGRSAGYQKSTRCTLRESSPTPAKCLSRNLQGNSCNKVDRVIAELLIDALNRPDEMGIEIVKSPKDMSRDKSARRQIVQRRNTTPRRSANSSKYHQIFEVIPEEKSSLSVDSSTDEPLRSSKLQLESASSNMKSLAAEHVTSSTAITKEMTNSNSTSAIATTTTTSNSTSSQKTSNSGREAVDRAEPKAWIGFFKRHSDSSMDEDDIPSQSYPDSSIATSCQNTITSPSTNTAAAGSSPKATSSAECITSAESDNILKLIENTFHNGEPQKREEPSSSEYEPKLTTTTTRTTTTSETFRSTCKSYKTKEKCNTIDSDNTLLKIELKQSESSSLGSSPSSTIEASSDPKESMFEKKVPPGQRPRKPPRPDVWRVQSPDICKMAIPKCKAKRISETVPSTEATGEIDSRSFTIFGDCNSSPSRHTSKIPIIGPEAAESTASVLTNRCITCCFCNPELHKSIQNTASTPCVYCNRKRTPPKREEETNTESDFFYQTMTKSDHIHVRTRSRESDVISTKCTKTNEKIKKFIPEVGITKDAKSKVPKNLSRPKNTANLPKRDLGAVHKIAQDNTKSKETRTKISNTDGKTFRLPSPYTNLSSNYDRTSSPSSSSESTCPTTPSRCPLLPASRRQNFTAKRQNSKRSNRKQDPVRVANNNQTASDNANNNNGVIGNRDVKGNGHNNGWSVTVAGSYSQDLAPDLEMRLSFPKRGSPHLQQAITTNPPSRIVNEQRDFQRITNGNLYSESLFQDEDIVNDNYSRTNHNHQALPLATNMNPKKTLTRIVSERTHCQRDINFPEVNPSRNPMMTKQMAKKAIKQTECSVAVTSATRTISNFTRGRRTMSYQALNTESHRYNNRDRHIIRDNSLDLGNLSSRRTSLDSQHPSEYMALSILGNAIAPEQKPRVPTMSEKDLTRRHNACFTRNRAFFT